MTTVRPDAGAMSTSAVRLEPVQPGERIEALDMLRGFALVGILLVNIQRYFAGAPFDSRADVTAAWFVRVFGSWHFFPLYAFLFGVGFAIQLSRAEARGTPFLSVYLRRLGALLLIGLAFFVFVEQEVILLQYAILGAGLLLFRNRSPRALLAWFVVFLAVAAHTGQIRSVVLSAIGSAPAEQAQSSAATERAMSREATGVRVHEARIAGTYGALVSARVRDLRETNLFVSRHPASAIMFSMFLLGFYAHRRGIFNDLDANRGLLQRTLLWSAALGGSIALATFRAVPWIPNSPIWPVRDVAFTIFYIAAVLLLIRWTAARRVLTLLRWTGRMGLTNYVLQFVIVTTLFYGYGLGLYRSRGAAMGPVFAVLATLTLIPLSVWWLRRYRFGPLEWVWRSLTYGKLQSMSIEPAARSTAPVPWLRGTVAVLVVGIAAVTITGWQPAASRRSAEAAIATLEGDLRQALLSADTAVLRGMATSDYAARGATGSRTSLAQLVESIGSGSLRYDAITPRRTTVVAHERTASASGIETHVSSLSGNSVGGERRYVRFYVKRDGRWLLNSSELARPF